MKTFILILIIKALFIVTSNAQVTEDVQLIIKAGRFEEPLQYTEDVKQFYITNGYKYAWTTNASNKKYLL